MTPKSKSRERNGVTILDLSGRMTLGEDTVLRVYNGQESGWRAEAAESHKKVRDVLPITKLYTVFDLRLGEPGS